MNSQEIAKTIQQQILAVGFPIVMSWGANAYQSMKEETLESFGIKGLGALKFKVDGMKFKGHVIVVLNYIDTYDVYFGKLIKDTFTIEKTLNDVYFDELGNMIDEFVEKQDNYRY